MSFSRHEQSIVRWGFCLGGEQKPFAQILTVSMSRSWLFLGELLSSRARRRFTSRHQFYSVGWICKPFPTRCSSRQRWRNWRDQLLQNLAGGGLLKADDLMRRRSADSIMASVEYPSSQQQAGYMYASLSRCSSKKALAYGAGPYMTPRIRPIWNTIRTKERGKSDGQEPPHGGADDCCAEAG